MPVWGPAEVRFWRKVRKLAGNGCWEWTASLNEHGYGQFWDGQNMRLAHRYSYELHGGVYAPDLVTDHLCRNPICVRPDHLEAVTQLVNRRRGVTLWGQANTQGAKTHCPKGHPYDDANTHRTPDGRRVCRACSLAYQRDWNARHPGKAAEYMRRHRERKRAVI